MPAAEKNSAAVRSVWDGQAVGIGWVVGVRLVRLPDRFGFSGDVVSGIETSSSGGWHPDGASPAMKRPSPDAGFSPWMNRFATRLPVQ